MRPSSSKLLNSELRCPRTRPSSSPSTRCVKRAAGRASSALAHVPFLGQDVPGFGRNAALTYRSRPAGPAPAPLRCGLSRRIVSSLCLLTWILDEAGSLKSFTLGTWLGAAQMDDGHGGHNAADLGLSELLQELHRFLLPASTAEYK